MGVGIGISHPYSLNGPPRPLLIIEGLLSSQRPPAEAGGL
jgi:hypothetical protein